MEEVLLKIDETKRGAFIIEDDKHQLGEMIVHLEKKDMVIESTRVNKEMRGRNLGKKLLDTMVDHARKNNYMVIPICPYVKGHFNKHPEEYMDLWKQSA